MRAFVGEEYVSLVVVNAVVLVFGEVPDDFADAAGGCVAGCAAGEDEGYEGFVDHDGVGFIDDGDVWCGLYLVLVACDEVVA